METELMLNIMPDPFNKNNNSVIFELFKSFIQSFLLQNLI